MSGSNRPRVDEGGDAPLDDFDALLNLEETYYAEGFALGKSDGVQAGLAEGRAIGLQRGFERFATMGNLHGRSVVWQSRADGSSLPEKEVSLVDGSFDGSQGGMSQQFMAPVKDTTPQDLTEEELMQRLKAVHWRSMRQNPRLRKHVQLLYGLTEPESLSMENKEDDVAEFEDRLRRAVAKAGIIGKIVGESVASEATQGEGGSSEDRDGAMKGGRKDIGIEDIDILAVRH